MGAGKIIHTHSLDFNKGGLVMNNYNNLCDRVYNLDIKAFMPLNLRNNPLIHTGT